MNKEKATERLKEIYIDEEGHAWGAKDFLLAVNPSKINENWNRLKLDALEHTSLQPNEFYKECNRILEES